MARVQAGRAAEGKTISSLPVKKLTFVPTGNGKPSKTLREVSDVEIKWSFLFSRKGGIFIVWNIITTQRLL